MFALIANMKPLFHNFYLLNIANRKGDKRPLTFITRPSGLLLTPYSSIVDQYNAMVEQYNTEVTEGNEGEHTP